MSILVDPVPEKQNSSLCIMDAIRICNHCGNEFNDLYRVCCFPKYAREIPD